MRPADPLKAPRILDSAAQLFAERPYHEVRMDDIAARASVAKGTLYLHFRDKESLYLALIEDGMTRQLCETLAHVADVEDPFEKLRLLIRSAILFFEKYPYLLDLIPSLEAKLANRPDVPLRARKAEFVALIRTVLAEIDATGRLKVRDPAFASICLIGILHEVLKTTPPPWPEDLVGTIGDHFLHGVRGAGG